MARHANLFIYFFLIRPGACSGLQRHRSRQGAWLPGCILASLTLLTMGEVESTLEIMTQVRGTANKSSTGVGDTAALVIRLQQTVPV